MGAAAAGGRGTLPTHGCGAQLTELLGGARPDELAAARGIGGGLLELDLHTLCELYYALAPRCGGAAVPIDGLPLSGADRRALLRLLAPRAAVPAAQLLVLLALVSRTHARTKLRFVFGVYDSDGDSYVGMQDFLDAATSLVLGACCLARAPRHVWPTPESVALLALPVFAPFDPMMSKESFLASALEQGHLWRVLQRFSADAPDQPFVLVPRDDLEPACPGPPLSARPSVRPASARCSALPSARSSAVSRCLPASVVGDFCGERPLRKRGYFQAVPTRHEKELQEELVRLQRGPHQDAAAAAKPSDPRGSENSSVSPGASVESPGAASRGVVALALDIKRKVAAAGEELRDEVTVQNELAAEMGDEIGRWEYRQELQQLRRRGPFSAFVPRPFRTGRLWTMSRAHHIRGGQMPPGVAKPVSPAEAQSCCTRKALKARRAAKGVRSDGAHGDATGEQWNLVGAMRSGDSDGYPSEPASPSATAVSKGAARSIAISSIKFMSQSSAPDSVDGADSRSSNGDGRGHGGAVASHASGPGYIATVHSGMIRCSDVILAMECFRAHYWNRECDMDKTFTEEEEATKLIDYRAEDIEAMLRSPQQVEPPSAAWRALSSRGVTLRSFLRCIWPACTPVELRTMIEWIGSSARKPQLPLEAKGKETPARQARALKELLGFFDSLDEQQTGLVPFVIIERFLSGELVTPLERRRLEATEAHRGAHGTYPRSCAEYAWHVDHVRQPLLARFIQKRVPDRPEEWGFFFSRSMYEQVRVRSRVRTEDTIASQAASRKRANSIFADPDGRARMRSAHKKNFIVGVGGDGLAENSTMRSTSRRRCSEDGGVAVVGTNWKDVSRQLTARMERLALFLDEQCAFLKLSGQECTDQKEEAGASVPLEEVDLECAFIPEAIGEWQMGPNDNLDEEGREMVRLPRLYWRYLIGCAILAQLRDAIAGSPCFLDFRPDGRVNLVTFMCIVAHDQVNGLFSSRNPPTDEAIRRIVTGV
eukprot:TRINITY_DN10009_c1_g2_i1.p1 TRINITY_DN10009_c1_g2~~TRINITY_DN10009_c1_g2_i1.p1  ORF type:complete len:996 (+),score=213.76 TRINITY_DN10009_c1_g2_i1:127-3114(+)